MGEPDDETVWAGDDIPVPAPPAVDISPAAVPMPSERPEFARADSEHHDPDGHEPDDRSRRNRTAVIVGAVAAFVLVATVVATWGGGDSPAADTSTTTEREPTATIEPIDAVGTTEPDAIPIRPPTTTVARSPVALGSLDLPAAIAAIDVPTEVVMLTSDGLLHTLSLPSGRVRSVPLSSLYGGTEVGGQDIVVAPEAAAVVVGSNIVIVPRANPATIVVPASDLPPNGFALQGWAATADGHTRFTGVGYGPGDGAFDVALDGTVSTFDHTVDQLSTIRAPDGAGFVNDAGGVYSVAPDGSARRIDDGVLRAVGRSSLLVRECSDGLVCRDVLVDRATGERRDIADGIIPDPLRFNGFGLDLAPDGSAVSGIADDGRSQDRVVVDLTTGAQVTTTNLTWTTATRWAADSSGVFELSDDGSGIEFLDRASGTAVHFADELGLITSLAVRMPETELGPESTVVPQQISFDSDTETLPSGLRIVALAQSGNLVMVDIDARSAEVWTSPEAIPAREPSVFQFADRVAVVSGRSIAPDAPSGYVAVPGDERPLPAGLFGPGPFFSGPVPGTVWTAAPSTRRGVEQQLVDLERAALAEPRLSISVPGGVLLGGDGRGGIVVEKGGDVYVATPSSLQRLTSGELLSIGVDTAYVRECDDSSSCAIVRIDRDTGERSALDDAAAFGSAVGIDASRPWGLTGSSVAPGGALAVVRIADAPAESSDSATAWALVDVAGASTTPLGDLSRDVPIVWSDDGTGGATLIGSQLVVFGAGMAAPAAVRDVGSLRNIAGAHTAAPAG